MKIACVSVFLTLLATATAFSVNYFAPKVLRSTERRASTVLQMSAPLPRRELLLGALFLPSIFTPLPAFAVKIYR